MPSQKPFMASHYKVKTYDTCPRQYYFEYLDPDIASIKRDLKKPRPELEVGNAVHVTLFRYFKEPLLNRNFQTLKQILNMVWKPPRGPEYGFNDIIQEREWYKEALLMLKTFYEHQTDGDQLFYVPDPFSREELIRIPLHDTLTLQGKVDRIDEEGDDLHVIDYKTGRSQNDDDFQVMCYVLLAEKNFGRRVKKASYFYLRSGYWKTYTPGEGDAMVTLEKIKRLVETIQADKEYPAKPSNMCKYCDYIQFCPSKKEAMEYVEGKHQSEDESSELPF